MMKLAFTMMLVSIGIFSANNAEAKRIRPRCQPGYKDDSVGRGIEAGFLDQKNANPPAPGDLTCFNLGKDFGQKLKETADDLCVGQFSDGWNRGLADSGNTQTPECFTTGYTAGTALFHVSMRTREVSPFCQDAYDKGRSDGAANHRDNPGRNKIYTDCYNTGYDDQQQGI